jgi:hypothetical protein
MVVVEAGLDQLQEFLVLLVEVHQDIRVHILAEREIALLELQHQFLLKVILVDLLITPIMVRAQEVEVLVVLEEEVAERVKDQLVDLEVLDRHHQSLDLLFFILVAVEEEVGVVLVDQVEPVVVLEVVEAMVPVVLRLQTQVVEVVEAEVMDHQDLVVLVVLALLLLLIQHHNLY